MKLRTPIRIGSSLSPIHIKDQITLIGSCFSENIGQKLLGYKFRVCANPFGIIYNPVSIAKLLSWVMKKELASQIEDYYVLHDEVWYNYHLHSKIAYPDKDYLKTIIQEKSETLYESLYHSKYLILTFGTAFVYQLESEVVSNCHKQSSRLFTKNLIDLIKSYEKMSELINTLKKFGTEKRIILTVSPVRHIKEGLAENNLSKSILRVLAHQLSDKYENVNYFPAYEMMIDDLRDYRFYEQDLIHPNEQAIDYIWQSFVSTWMDNPTQNFIKKWSKVKSSLAHKPFFPSRKTHQDFLEKLLSILEGITEVDTQEEKNLVLRQLESSKQ